MNSCTKYTCCARGALADTNVRKLGVVLAFAIALAPAWIPHGAVAQPQPRVPVEHASTAQKAKFVGNLVGQSVTATKIEQSGDLGAIRKLSEARVLVQRAEEDIANGMLTEANAKLDSALSLVNGEARRLSHAELRDERQKEEYDRRHHAVQTFMAAYDRVAEGKEMSAGAAEQMAKIRDLVTQAENQAADGQLEEANGTLDSAYRVARGDIREMRDGKTLVRSLDFSTPEKEYKYEHDRNDSHVMLLQFAINEKSPPELRRKRIDALLAEAMEVRAQAESLAKRGSHADAIESLTRSTDTLLKAIRMSGVWVPG